MRVQESLAERFLDRTRLDIDRLSDLLKRAVAGDRTVFAGVAEIAHSIHGSSAMFGFSALSGAGGAMSRLAERAIADAELPRRCSDPEMLEQLASHRAWLVREVEAAGKAAPRGDGIFPHYSTGG